MFLFFLACLNLLQRYTPRLTASIALVNTERKSQVLLELSLWHLLHVSDVCGGYQCESALCEVHR